MPDRHRQPRRPGLYPDTWVFLDTKEEYLADILLVDGNPRLDLTLLQDMSSLACVMKDGKLHKRPNDS